MIPYGIALGAVTQVGSSLGANKPADSVLNSTIIFFSAVVISVLLCLSIAATRHEIVEIFSTETEVNA